MRIAVIGVGGVGGYFGGRLAEAGEEVTFVARGATVAALREKGLRVDSINGDFTINPARATDDARTVGEVDVVIVAVKTWQLKEAATSALPMLGKNTVVVTLQNGVDAGDQVAEVVGSEHVAPGVCGIVAFIVEPGHIRHSANPTPFVRFGEMDNRASPRLEALREAFVRAKVTAQVAPDVHTALWMKLMFLGPSSGIGALTGTPIGEWRAKPDTRRMLEEAMNEIFAVGTARGVKLAPDAVAKSIEFVDSVAPDATMSMQRDIMAGKQSELEAQIGAIVRFGKAANVATPVHAMLYDKLRGQ